MVIIQPSTRKVVLLYERRRNYWFLPKGRKDIGESLEQTALREAYEEVSIVVRMTITDLADSYYIQPRILICFLSLWTFLDPYRVYSTDTIYIQ